MKEKTNRMSGKKATVLAILLVVGITLTILVPPFIVMTVHYNVTLEKMKHEIASYSSDTYEKLLEAVNAIFKEEEKVIDINAKPENILIKALEKQEDKYVCELLLDEETANKYSPIPRITVEISEDLKILSIKSNYSSEETVIQEFKENIMKDSSNFAIVVCGIEGLLAMAVYGVSVIRGGFRKERK